MMWNQLAQPTPETQSFIDGFNDKEKKDHIDDHAAISFSNEVIKLIKLSKISAVEAIIEISMKHLVNEDEDIIQLITPKLMSILQSDSEDRKLLKTTRRTKRVF